MKRLLLLLCLLGFGAGASDFQKLEFTGENGEKLLYNLLAPQSIEEGKLYPLVLFLHGAGERGDDNAAQLRHGAKDFAKPEMRAAYPCFVLAPQCPKEKKWAEVNWGAAESHDLPAEPSEPMALLLELLPQVMAEHPVDPARVYVIGLSMGGFGTWDILARRPELFAAAVPICGGADVKTAPAIAHIPVWVWHGAEDNTVKTVRSRIMVEALRAAGGEPKYDELPGVAHNSWAPAFANPELYKWLFAQTKK